jgi:hypothetical protein
MRIISLFTIILCLLVHFAYSQNSLYLRPCFGFQKGIDFIKQQNPQVQLLQKDFFGDDMLFSLLLEYRTGKYSFSSGIHFGIASYNYGYRYSNSSQRFSSEFSAYAAAGLNGVPFLVGYTLNKPKYTTDIKLKKPKLHLEYELQGGLMYNRWADNAIFDKLSEEIVFGDTLSTLAQTRVVNRNGVSVMGGIRFALMRGDKPTLTATLFFNQGLVNYIDVTINYQIANFKDVVVLGSRGTTYGIYASYPILLKKWKKKEEL